MNWNVNVLLDAERRLRIVGATVGTLCAAAEIDRSSWTLWKAGKFKPRPKRWQRVERELREIERQFHAARAA
jgi:hypothetical protein